MLYVELQTLWRQNCLVQKNISEKKPMSGHMELLSSSWPKEDIHLRALNFSSFNGLSTKASTSLNESIYKPLSNLSLKY